MFAPVDLITLRSPCVATPSAMIMLSSTFEIEKNWKIMSSKNHELALMPFCPKVTEVLLREQFSGME